MAIRPIQRRPERSLLGKIMDVVPVAAGVATGYAGGVLGAAKGGGPIGAVAGASGGYAGGHLIGSGARDLIAPLEEKKPAQTLVGQGTQVQAKPMDRALAKYSDPNQVALAEGLKNTKYIQDNDEHLNAVNTIYAAMQKNKMKGYA